MRKKIVKVFIISIILGIVITMITGLFLNQGQYLGSSRWGYPVYWLSQMVVGPEYSPPLNVVWLNLLIDITIWSILFIVILIIVFRNKMD